MQCADDAFAAASVERQRSLEPYGARAESSPAISLTRPALLSTAAVVSAAAVAAATTPPHYPPHYQRARPLRRALSALAPAALAARVRSPQNIHLKLAGERDFQNESYTSWNFAQDNCQAENASWTAQQDTSDHSYAKTNSTFQIHIPKPRFAQDCFAWNDAASVETWAAICSARIIQPPLLYMSEYGARWDVDLFVLPHNAVRAELMDMVDILNAFARAGHNLTLGHMHDFGAWWAVFEDFLTAYFAIDDAVLLPWAYDALASMSGLGSDMDDHGDGQDSREVVEHRIATTARRNRVELLAKEVGNAFTLFRCKPSGEVLPLLYRALQAFLPRLLSYMARQEHRVSRSPEPSSTYRAELRRRLFNAVLSSKQPLTNVFLLTRWAPEDTGVHRLLRSQIRGPTRLKLHAHVRHIHTTHLRIVDNFRNLHLRVLDKPTPFI